ncbi:MAG: metallophosphoesterase [Verrucomicrobiota bacterium]
MAIEPVSRRRFLGRGALVLAAAAFGKSVAKLAAGETPVLQFGLITDVHYADREHAGSRYYRESLGKMREAVGKFRAAQPAFVVQVGDLIDEAPTVAGEAGHAQIINAEFGKFAGDRYHVLGNHDVWTLTKAQYLEAVGQKEAHYSFDKAGFHFVVLDACYRRDGVAYGGKNNKWDDTDVPAAQREWLAEDLHHAGKPTIVFIHQRTDIAGAHSISSDAAVRQIFEQSGQVLAVFQGHHHVNDHKEIAGIHYVTLMATVDGTGEVNNAYALIDVFKDGTIAVNGFRKQKNYAVLH